MSALKNPKHEQFCQLIFEGTKYGWSQGVCYIKAGFKSVGHSAETNASRLLKRDDIRGRLAELGEPAVKRSRVTIESLIEQFDTVFDNASADKQHGAANAAAANKAKLVGYLRDRLEIGAPGDFSDCESPTEVVEKLLTDLDTQEALAAIDSMRELVLARAAVQARDVTPELRPRAYRSESTLALETLRPTLKGKR